MRRLASPVSSLACAALLVCALPALASGQTPRNRPLQPNEQWVQLFNGKDLTNWVEVGKEKWVIEDGAIHGQGVSSAYGYLRTEKTYKDFWLSLRFKCEADGNSGVYFHTYFKPAPSISQGKSRDARVLIITPATVRRGRGGSLAAPRPSRGWARPTGTTC